MLRRPPEQLNSIVHHSTAYIPSFLSSSRIFLTFRDRCCGNLTFNLTNKSPTLPRSDGTPLPFTLNISPTDVPSGIFNLPENTNIPVVMIAGGVGIVPFMSMLRFVSENRLGYKIKLLFTDKSKNRAPYLDEIRKIKSSNIKLVFKSNACITKQPRCSKPFTIV